MNFISTRTPFNRGNASSHLCPWRMRGGDLDNSSVLVYVVDDAPEVAVEDTEPVKYNSVKTVNWEEERTQLIEDGNTIDEPSIEEKEWYNFLWWYSDKSCENKFDFDSSITRDITIYACRKAIYTVSFDKNYYWEEDEWTSLWEVQAEEWTTITPVSDPKREDYNFLWWAKEDECRNMIDFSEKEIKENFTVYACWEKLPSFFVKSFDEEWKVSDIQKINVWNTAVPYMTTNESWCKAIWQRDWEEYDFSTPVTEDIELHVVWDCNNKVEQVQKVEHETAEEWTWDNAQWWSSSNDTIQEITYNAEEITWEVTYAGVTVKVVAPIGSFPENTELVIKPIETVKEIKKVQDALVEQVEEIDNSTFMVSFDISFIDPETKEELQPSNDKTVEVTFNYEENSRLKESDTNDDITLKVYHLEDKDEAWNKLDEVEVKEIVELKNDVEWEVTIDAEKFSTYTVVLWNETPELEATLIWDDDARNAFKYRTITISDGATSYTLMDRNLWARTVWDGTTWTAESNSVYDSSSDVYGYYYQWWNKYGFSLKTTSSSSNVIEETISDVTENSTYYNTNWNKKQPWSSNNYLWWYSRTEADMQWPCPSWWHVPTKDEWQAIYNAWNSSTNKSTSEASTSKNFAKDLKLPPAGNRLYSNLSFYNRGSYGSYWSSTPSTADRAYGLFFDTSNVSPQDVSRRSNGRAVRCLQNSPTRTVTFTANWETFKSVDVKRWSTVSQPSPAPTTSNGTFQGWYPSVWADTAFNFSTPITEDTELYAKWDCKTWYSKNAQGECVQAYTVTYNATTNGGSVTQTSEGVEKWSTLTLWTSHNPAIKDWWTFVWWNTSATAQVGLDSIVVNANTTLYAIFSRTVTITFDANGSAWSNKDETCTMYNTATTCPITAPSISVSAGWTPAWYDDDQNGHVNEWSVGDTHNVSTSWTYFAQIKKSAINYTATFEKNGATSLSEYSDDCTVPEVWNWAPRDETCTVTTPTIVREWWTKLWFNTDSSAESAIYAQWVDIALSSNATYHAITKKEAIDLTANVDWNNSTLSSNSQLTCTLAAVYNTNTQETYCDVTMPTVTPNTNTPQFIGWNIVANTDVNNTAYTVWTNKLRLTSDNTNRTWYAITTAPEKTLTITYWMWVWVSEIWKTSDSCTIAATYNGAEQAASCTVTAPSITVSNGYSNENKKWIDQSETTTQVAPWATITLTSDKHLSASAQYRAWSTPISYSITYHLDGWVQEWWKDNYTVEDNTFTLVNPTKEHYTFAWWTGTDLTEPTLTVTIEQWAKYENLEYYATWKEDMNNNGIDDATEEKHTITIKDGETILATIELISWVVISLPTPPVKDWYTFEGWDWLPADGKATDENLTITAKWKKVETTPVDNTPRAWGGGGGRIVSNNTTSTTTTTNEHGSAEEKTSDDKNTSDNLNTNLDSENTEKTTSPVDSNIESNEVTDVYTWAHKNRITTMPSIEEATPDGYVKRWHLAKMLVNYSVNVLWKEIPTVPKECKKWSDDRDFESAEIREYAEKACALWLMWIDTENHRFDPDKEVTRAQFGTTISRMLYGDKYQWGFPYYEKHLKALNENNIMKNIINPQDRIELRKWIWVMLQRIQEKKK